MRKSLFLIGILTLAFAASGCNYNDITAKQQATKKAWADIEAQLQARADLLPNLIKAAKFSATQEQEVFGTISEARSRLLNATNAAPPEEKTPEQRQAVIDAANSFGGTIGRILSLQESYPELKSNELFLKAQDEISGTERRIAVRREDYNKVVGEYNTAIKQFPGVLTASLFGFKEEPFFKAAEGSDKAPDLGDPNSIRKNSAPPANK